ncbi:MAG: transcription-repair coupling factor [Paludibacteraceae bacterium]|nr:transcription-repair coupling factor [Paludibacteraceae bacterium]
MTIEDLHSAFLDRPEIKAAIKELKRGGETHLLLSGLHASARALAIEAIAIRTMYDVRCTKDEKRVFFVVIDNEEDAKYLYADLKGIGCTEEAYPQPLPKGKGEEERRVYFFPSSKRRRTTDEAMVIQRTECLAALRKPTPSPSLKGREECTVYGVGCKDDKSQEAMIIVTYPEAINETVPAQDTLSAISCQFTVGQEIQQSTLANQLSEIGFERVDFVFEPGQYAIRGGIVDIYSYSHDMPYRLDFFGDEIDSIREFDIEDQLSKNKVTTAQIVGKDDVGCTMLDFGCTKDQEASILDYLSENTIWISNDFAVVKYKVPSIEYRVQSSEYGVQRTIEMAEKSYFTTYSHIAFHTIPQPVFNKQFDLLTANLQEYKEKGYAIYILAEQKKQLDRLAAIVESTKEAYPQPLPEGKGEEECRVYGKPTFTPIQSTLHGGFIDHDLKICCYTDHQIFERYHRVQMSSENARRGKAIITLREINQLQIGDFVVHSDHGIAKFGGLVNAPVNGKMQEKIKLLYRDGAAVYVSIHNLHRISKYKGREGEAPTLGKLGGGAWERLKERTKSQVKDIARDLIRIYAARKQQQGFAYAPDGYMQHALEASFLYEDTPDQAKATADIKRDMERPMPMDRLVCGDVGFGKTEVAMRAAFKAATDGKQVAVLVPTTVLALQHYNTFRERMANTPAKIAYLSRRKTAKETKEILEQLANGQIDILIGTHKIVNKNIKWHDLGLLIIDEEQKFGVAVKERLKSMRANIDVLTLTATPIPRTLQFSLLGARDLSIMTTPPQNRYPVQTELITLDDEDLIKEAIDLEMERNGQIFAVCNRIEMLPRIENRLRRLCPNARIVTAHGQMPSGEMEERLEAFINYDYDVLIATTIIESGVDIPNANTMLIFAAQNYGLADLHQLRGRVGRSNRKAYCYLITPDRELITSDARRRLEALSTFAELGAGFNLAMQDLDIRGAGNLLGAEQSGFIADLGYETYQRILNEAVEELQEEMEAYPQPLPEGKGENAYPMVKQWCSDSQLETDLSIHFPPLYIENISERITLYRELDNLHSEQQLLDYRKKLIDRFGPLPEEADELLSVVKLRWLCCQLGIEKVFLKQEQLTIFFVQRKEAYWQSEAFGKIIQFIMERPQRCSIQEEFDKKGHKTGRRYATIKDVRTIGGAIHLLSKVIEN